MNIGRLPSGVCLGTRAVKKNEKSRPRSKHAFHRVGSRAPCSPWRADDPGSRHNQGWLGEKPLLSPVVRQLQGAHLNRIATQFDNFPQASPGLIKTVSVPPNLLLGTRVAWTAGGPVQGAEPLARYSSMTGATGAGRVSGLSETPRGITLFIGLAGQDANGLNRQ